MQIKISGNIYNTVCKIKAWKTRKSEIGYSRIDQAIVQVTLPVLSDSDWPILGECSLTGLSEKKYFPQLRTILVLQIQGDPCPSMRVVCWSGINFDRERSLFYFWYDNSQMPRSAAETELKILFDPTRNNQLIGQRNRVTLYVHAN